jgi:hypothetical protein
MGSQWPESYAARILESVFTQQILTLCGPVANLLAFGFLNVRTGSQLFGF